MNKLRLWSYLLLAMTMLAFSVSTTLAKRDSRLSLAEGDWIVSEAYTGYTDIRGGENHDCKTILLNRDTSESFQWQSTNGRRTWKRQNYPLGEKSPGPWTLVQSREKQGDRFYVDTWLVNAKTGQTFIWGIGESGMGHWERIDR